MLPGQTGSRDAGDLQPDATVSDASLSSIINEEIDPIELVGNDCSLPLPSTSKLVAVDSQDRIYLAAVCDGEISVAVSSTGGRSYSSFKGVGLPESLPGAAVAMSASPTGVLLATVGQNQITLVQTKDGGVTWSAPEGVGSAQPSLSGLTVVRSGGTILILAQSGGARRVARSEDDGDSWDNIMVPTQAAYADIVAGEDPDTFYIVGADPEVRIQRSDDKGQSFQPEETLNETMLRFSDFASNEMRIVGVGTNSNAIEINYEELSATQLSPILPPAVQRGRSVQVLADNLVYVLTNRSPLGVELHRLEEPSSRAIDAMGERASFFAVRNGVVVVVFSKQEQIFSTVQLF